MKINVFAFNEMDSIFFLLFHNTQLTEKLYSHCSCTKQYLLYALHPIVTKKNCVTTRMREG